jgi:nitrite reductase/ring-hydroxylating ferredoxin subunit
MSNRLHVGKAEEFEQDELKTITDDGLEICVIHTDGEFYALGNRCPHRGGCLHKGEVNHEVSEDRETACQGQRPELVFTNEKVVTCPWHGWEYYIDTGEHAGDPTEGVPRYDTVIEDGNVYVEL